MHWEAFQDRNRQWRLRLKAANGKIIVTGEAYSDRHELNDTIASIAKSVSVDGVGMSVVTTTERLDEPGGLQHETATLADWVPRGE